MTLIIIDAVENAVALPEMVRRAPRRYLGKIAAPTDRGPEVREVMLDGADAVFVELSGRHGVGREMILDPADWDATRALTKWWTVCDNGGGNHYVGSGRAKFRGLTGQAAECPLLRLARALTGAERGKVVLFVNGNSLDLRRSNMEVVSRSEAARRRAELRRMMA